ncbi:thioredoxin-disulfide reductase [Limosilactobacillus fastidiosus]|uniref:Thioredoxin reductase n=1 Tax=Limosilactobacillus fastidiosus TaxID=2759855 RepID=A0A7W3YCL5_9LACO|nr:thioredoxin-disulfide reductase [Limosilactobacillus fastidiosus]MBB1063242.1 thioredoxin-disulfide reductase [Limosilactobacillus fastidiosus]MBB1086117.1 thioredoxin-disulfide reductase [Limosilactobacillus fastidiosus]MCD7084473.1 thioredoxin-disulfide reductase [Limosilactobacillus fastidiosus]MCD7085032.1 thioredoxin-disulfide reductase [Limosilactobacillus fastidiosus]MCD7114544.1 thioredoxin-disulfide reductase [Limosilactobacillus fastidiosus]
MANKDHYDVVVIGAGPGGMTAAMYASRANLSVLMLDRGIYGGNLNNTATIENYTGFKSIKGPELAQQMFDGSTQFGAEYAYGTVTKIEVNDDKTRTVFTDMDDQFIAKAIVIATGSEQRHLDVPGEDEFSGRGVSYCAVCDGAFFRDRPLIVVGGGDSAVEEGLYLANLASQVTVLVRGDKLRAQPLLQDEAMKNDKMKFIFNTSVTEIVGDDAKVTGVKTHNNKTGEDGEMPADGIFIYVGNVPMTKQFASLGITNGDGWIKTDNTMKTKISGIFAVGDVRETPLRQIATAVGDGSIAGQQVYQYIQSL